MRDTSKSRGEVAPQLANAGINPASRTVQSSGGRYQIASDHPTQAGGIRSGRPAL